MKPAWPALRDYWALLVGFAVLLAVAGDTLRVRKENRDLAAMIERDRATVVAIGDRISDLAGTKINGSHARYRLVGSPAGSLVIAMSSMCDYCQRNLDAWRRLSSKARRLGVQVVWVNRDSAMERTAGQQPVVLDESLVADPTHWTYVHLKLATVPQTLIVRNDGIVEDARAGVIDAVIESSLSAGIDAIAHRGR